MCVCVCLCVCVCVIHTYLHKNTYNIYSCVIISTLCFLS